MTIRNPPTTSPGFGGAAVAPVRAPQPPATAASPAAASADGAVGRPDRPRRPAGRAGLNRLSSSAGGSAPIMKSWYGGGRSPSRQAAGRRPRPTRPGGRLGAGEQRVAQRVVVVGVGPEVPAAEDPAGRVVCGISGQGLGSSRPSVGVGRPGGAVSTPEAVARSGGTPPLAIGRAAAVVQKAGTAGAGIAWRVLGRAGLRS